MNVANETTSGQPVRVIRPGLLDRIKQNNGLKSDEALARIMGVSRNTLQRYRNGAEPSLGAVALLADAFGLAIGEIVVRPELENEAVSA